MPYKVVETCTVTDEEIERILNEWTGKGHVFESIQFVTAVSSKAFEQSLGVLRNGGTVCWIGLPGGEADNIRLAISSVVNGEISIRGSNVGTRQDLQEAVEFAASGLVRAKIEKQPLEAINDVFARMKKGAISGRVVLAIE